MKIIDIIYMIGFAFCYLLYNLSENNKQWSMSTMIWILGMLYIYHNII